MNNNIEDKILAKIKDENLKPKSVWYFIFKDFSLWGMVFISVLLAAISIAPIIFIFQNLELGYAKHISDNVFLFIIFMLPYGWIILCMITTFLATIAWEKTKHGYRFDGKYIFVSAFLASLILGIILNIWSFGKFLDDEAGNLSYGNYKSFRQKRDENWFKPENGRIVGNVIDISTTSFVIVNSANNFQKIISYDISVPGNEYIELDNKLRIIGFMNKIENDDPLFIACAIFPDNMLMQFIKKHDRDEKIEKMKEIFETYPECKEMFKNGRAFFRQ